MARYSAIALTVVSALFASATLVACSEDGGGAKSTGASGCIDPAKGTIKVGLLYNGTGPVAGEFKWALQGAQARLKLAAERGGPRVEMNPSSTTGSDPTENLHAAQKLVGDDVFAILEDDLSDVGSSAYLTARKIPVVGYNPGSAPGWVESDNMFTWTAQPTEKTPPSLDSFFPDHGVTNLALVYLNGVQGAELTAKNTQEAFERATGGSAELFPVSVGQTDFTADITKLGRSGADGLYFITDSATGLKYYAAAKQAGLSFKAVLELNAYSTETLETYGKQMAGVYVRPMFAPVELASKMPAVKEYVDAMKKYAPSAPQRSSHATYGWAAADVLLHGIKLTGDCLTRERFMSALRKDATWDDNGMGAKTDFSYRGYRNCGFYARINEAGTAYVPVSNKSQCAEVVK